MKQVHIIGSYNIISGRKHGQAIGFRTLNFDLGGSPLVVETGIYAGYVTFLTKRPSPDISDEDRLFTSEVSLRHPAVFYYGPRPMINDPMLSFEAHLLDGPLTKTSTTASVELISYLRDVQTFDDEDALKQQIQQDVKEARQLLQAKTE